MIEALKTRFGKRIREIDADRWNNMFVVGDIHGCSAEFDQLLEKLDLQHDELLMCVGDVITKGPDSRGLVDRINDHPNIISILGNAEIDYLKRDISIPGLRKGDRAFIHRWPLILVWEQNVVVHGGINPQESITNHTLRSVLTMRSVEHGSAYKSPYWFEEYRGEERVFFGHTVTRQPIVRDTVVGLDTGCVYGGELTAYDCSRGECIAVESTETYQSPPDELYRVEA